MNVSRTLAASAFVAVSAAVLAGSPAQAGGDPGYEIGTVTVDRTATIDADRTAIGGTYTCNGAGDRIGSLSFQLLQRNLPPTEVETITGLTCDGAAHRWSFAAAIGTGDIRSGSATFWGDISVCESPEGPCPAKHVDQRIILRRAS